MGRFFSVPGMRPSGGEGGMNAGGGTVKLPDPYDHPRTREWAESRRQNTTRHIGVDGPQAFRGEGALVHGEEYDQHRGVVDQYVQRSTLNGSGTYKVTWEQTALREMTLVDTKPTFE